MKQIFITLILAVGMTAAFGQSKAVYVHPKFYSKAKDHQKIAVIPFTVQLGLRPKEREKMTDEQFNEMQRNEGLAAQSALVSWFLKKQNRQGYDLEFQDVSTTNALLKKAGMDINDLSSHTPDEIAKALGVDGIMGGMVKTSKPLSDGASIAMGALIGFYGSTNSGNISITLNDGDGGDLLWKYDNDLSGSLGSDMDAIMDALMRKAAKKFPYADMENLKKEEQKK